MELRTYLRDCLIQDQPGQALAALQAAKEDHLLAFDLSLIEARHETLLALQANPESDPESLRQRMNELNFSLLELSHQLPADAHLPADWQTSPPKPRKAAKPEGLKTEESEISSEPKSVPKGIADRRFQWHILVILLLVKGYLLVHLTVLHEGGALSNDQYNATLSILVPLVATYFGVMFKFFFAQRDPQKKRVQPETYTSRKVQYLTYGVFLLYALLYFLAMTTEGKNGFAQFKDFVARINGIEAVFGALIGYVIASLFKRSD